MKYVFTVRVRFGSCSSTRYRVVARSIEEAARKARREAKRDMLENPDVARLKKLGRAI